MLAFILFFDRISLSDQLINFYLNRNKNIKMKFDNLDVDDDNNSNESNSSSSRKAELLINTDDTNKNSGKRKLIKTKLVFMFLAYLHS